MTLREDFMNCVEKAINETDLFTETAIEYFNSLKTTKNNAGGLTENGAKILNFMREHKEEFNNAFKAKEIAEGLFMGSRAVSGSMRKLLTDGYCEKYGNDPVIYKLSE